MARLTTDIVYGVTGQTLEHRVMQGRPTSATFDVLDEFSSDDDTSEFSGSATVDSVTTTVSTASGRSELDPQKIFLTSTSAVSVDRKYLISEGSKQEWVQPIEIVTDDYIRVRYPLKNDYTTAATFVGTTITAAIDATWVADEGNLSDHLDPNPSYRVRWEIVVSGATYVAYSFFDLVRAPVRHQIDIDDIQARAPGLHDSMPTEYESEQGRPLVETAWRAVKAKLAAHNIDVDAFRNDEILDELTILKALRILAGGGWKPLAYDSVGQYVVDTERDFETFFQQHISVTQKSRLAADTGGGAQKVTALPFWSK